MNAPKRWTEPDSDAPDGASSLLRHALPSRPLDAAVRARSAARVAELAGASAEGLVAKTLWLKVGLAALGVAVATVGVVTGARPTTPARPPVAARSSSAPPRPIAPSPVTPTAPVASVAPPRAPSAPVAAPPPASPPAPRPRYAAPRPLPPRTPAPAPAPPSALPVVAPPAALPTEDALVREERSLRRVSSSVEGDPAGALAALAAHDAAFPRGQLGDERDFLAFEAHRRLGHDVRALGDAFLRAHPRSVHAATVRRRIEALP